MTIGASDISVIAIFWVFKQQDLLILQLKTTNLNTTIKQQQSQSNDCITIAINKKFTYINIWVVFWDNQMIFNPLIELETTTNIQVVYLDHWK